MQEQEYVEICGKSTDDFADKVRLNVSDEIQENDDEENEDFSFVCINHDGSPISADDVFHNGQIRTTFPIFDQSLLYVDESDNDYGEQRLNSSSTNIQPPLKKLFVEERSKSNENPTGPYCDWRSGKTVKEASAKACKKSNSTGFSKLWRFRELVFRSSSDGKDAFVFLNNNETTKSSTNSSKSGEKVKVMKGKTKKSNTKTVSSVYEKHYVKKEGDKRQSYPSYKQDVVGIFTNVNGLTKNVHPY